MQYIGKENINFQANTSTFKSNKQTSQQIPIDLDDMGGVADDGVGFSGKHGEHQIVDDAGDVDVDGVGVSINDGEQLVSENPKVMFMIHWVCLVSCTHSQCYVSWTVFFSFYILSSIMHIYSILCII